MYTLYYLSVLISMVTSMVPVCPQCYFAQARPTMLLTSAYLTPHADDICLTAYKRIKEQYGKLACCPFNILLPSLFSNRVITFGEKKIIETKPLEMDRMEYFLDTVLIPSLKMNSVAKYNGFIQVLEGCDDAVVKAIAMELSKYFYLSCSLDIPMYIIYMQ